MSQTLSDTVAGMAFETIFRFQMKILNVFSIFAKLILLLELLTLEPRIFGSEKTFDSTKKFFFDTSDVIVGT